MVFEHIIKLTDDGIATWGDFYFAIIIFNHTENVGFVVVQLHICTASLLF